jgi:hypothetical protein
MAYPAKLLNEKEGVAMNTTEGKEARKTRRAKPREEQEQAVPEDAVGMEESAEEEPIEEVMEPRHSRIGVAAKFAAAPVREAYFVGVGFLDWAVEQLWTAERAMADRGVRRSEAIRQAASRLKTSVSTKAAPAITKAGESVERIGEKVAAGSRKLRKEAPKPEAEHEEEVHPEVGMMPEQHPHPA